MSGKLRSWWSGTFGDGNAANGTKGSSGLHATVSSLQPVSVPPRRRIFVNLPQPDSFLDAAGFPSVQFPSNEVSTAKYSIITFLPKNLWEQFHRIANVFFLAMAVSQVFPVFQVTNAFMPFVPLVIVLTLTALKDGWEDYKRHKSDKELNNSLTRRLARHHNVNYLAEELDDRRRCFDGTLFWKTIDNLLAVLPCCESCLRPHMQRRRAKVLARQDELLRENHGYAVADAPSSFSKPEAYEEEWPVVTWSDLRVGDFVFLRKNDLIPADVVVLSTSDPDNLAYVETKNLDGETNLKSKVGPVDLRFLDSAYSCRGARFWLDSEGPNLNLYTYSGVIMIPTAAAAVGDGLNSLDRSPLADPAVDTGAKGAETSSIPRGVPLPEHASEGVGAAAVSDLRSRTVHGQSSAAAPIRDVPLIEELHRPIPLNISNLMLRGSVLRNTEWVVGLVAYTGKETKILLNAGATPHKRSRIERKMNIQVLLTFGILVLLCLGVTIAHMIYSQRWEDFLAPWFNQDYQASAGYGFITFWSSMILFQNLIPISLYVTIEIAKILQAYFIFVDIDIYYPENDQPCVPKNWSIADDLGQIAYIFSDKTGTLTMNKMEFRKCDILGTVYGAFDLRKDLSGETEHVEATHMFFRCLALCHTVATSVDAKTGEVHYNAESPDEQALVLSARDAGYVLKERTQRSITLSVRGHEEVYSLLQVLEFNSARKRMSIIVRGDGDKDEVLLLTKGADSIILPRLKAGDEVLKQQTKDNLETFAEEGLRTLCLAQRAIPDPEYKAWRRDYDAAASALSGREALLEACYDSIERDLTLLGTTAIEDRLQDAVPECIGLLREAGIKIWVLTGDKLETAINIGYSCNLLEAHMELIVVRDAGNASDAHQQLVAASQRVAALRGADVLTTTPSNRPGTLSRQASGRQAPGDMSQLTPHFGLVIDGETMKHAFETEEGSSELLAVALQCRSVICCRVTPKQKALVVRLAKKHLKCMCLAIGDGANDVGMIQEANVGVGIAGAEGLQAAMASDYVIGQFRFLAKLVLVHGRWSYMRCAEMILNFFYKSIVWVFSLFWYQCFTGFSTDVLFEYTFILFFNLIFTSLPVLVIGIFEQDVSAKVSIEVPQIYLTGIRQELFTVERFLLFVFDGLVQSVFVFFVTFAVFGQNVAWPTGYSLDDKLFLGAVIACYAITVSNLTVAFNILNWTWVAWVVITLEVLSVYVYLMVYGSIPSVDLYGYWRVIFGNLSFWAGLFLAIVCCLGPGTIVKLFRRTYYPTDLDITREISVLHLSPPRDSALAGGGIGEADAVLLGTTGERRSADILRSSSPHVTYAESSNAAGPADTGQPSSSSLARRMSVYSTLSRTSEKYSGYAFDKSGDPDGEGGVAWPSTLNTLQRAEAQAL